MAGGSDCPQTFILLHRQLGIQWAKITAGKCRTARDVKNGWNSTNRAKNPKARPLIRACCIVVAKPKAAKVARDLPRQALDADSGAAAAGQTPLLVGLQPGAFPMAAVSTPTDGRKPTAQKEQQLPDDFLELLGQMELAEEEQEARHRTSPPDCSPSGASGQRPAAPSLPAWVPPGGCLPTGPTNGAGGLGSSSSGSGNFEHRSPAGPMGPSPAAGTRGHPAADAAMGGSAAPHRYSGTAGTSAGVPPQPPDHLEAGRSPPGGNVMWLGGPPVAAAQLDPLLKQYYYHQQQMLQQQQRLEQQQLQQWQYQQQRMEQQQLQQQQLLEQQQLRQLLQQQQKMLQPMQQMEQHYQQIKQQMELQMQPYRYQQMEQQMLQSCHQHCRQQQEMQLHY